MSGLPNPSLPSPKLPRPNTPGLEPALAQEPDSTGGKRVPAYDNVPLSGQADSPKQSNRGIPMFNANEVAIKFADAVSAWEQKNPGKQPSQEDHNAFKKAAGAVAIANPNLRDGTVVLMTPSPGFDAAVNARLQANHERLNLPGNRVRFENVAIFGQVHQAEGFPPFGIPGALTVATGGLRLGGSTYLSVLTDGVPNPPPSVSGNKQSEAHKDTLFAFNLNLSNAVDTLAKGYLPVPQANGLAGSPSASAPAPPPAPAEINGPEQKVTRATPASSELAYKQIEDALAMGANLKDFKSNEVALFVACNPNFKPEEYGLTKDQLTELLERDGRADPNKSAQRLLDAIANGANIQDFQKGEIALLLTLKLVTPKELNMSQDAVLELLKTPPTATGASTPPSVATQNSENTAASPPSSSQPSNQTDAVTQPTAQVAQQNILSELSPGQAVTIAMLTPNFNPQQLGVPGAAFESWVNSAEAKKSAEMTKQLLDTKVDPTTIPPADLALAIYTYKLTPESLGITSDKLVVHLEKGMPNLNAQVSADSAPSN
jgi:hypothetical protein